MPQQHGRRDMRRTARDKPLEALLLLLRHRIGPPAQQTCQINMKHMSQKDPGFAMRRLDAASAKNRGRLAERVLDRARHASAAVKLASRAA